MCPPSPGQDAALVLPAFGRPVQAPLVQGQALGLGFLAGEVDVVFPEGTFPPGGPFVPFAV